LPVCLHIEVARARSLLTLRAAGLKYQRKPYGDETAVAEFYASEASAFITHKASSFLLLLPGTPR
jgi:hypothetical protein